jgi:UDP-sugar transporter A1/2/3
MPFAKSSHAHLLNCADSALTTPCDQPVLKFADAVLKGYATAISVILTGVLSMVLFGTKLSVLYLLGIGNVICSVILYSANDLDRLLC